MKSSETSQSTGLSRPNVCRLDLSKLTQSPYETTTTQEHTRALLTELSEGHGVPADSMGMSFQEGEEVRIASRPSTRGDTCLTFARPPPSLGGRDLDFFTVQLPFDLEDGEKPTQREFSLFTEADPITNQSLCYSGKLPISIRDDGGSQDDEEGEYSKVLEILRPESQRDGQVTNGDDNVVFRATIDLSQPLAIFTGEGKDSFLLVRGLKAYHQYGDIGDWDASIVSYKSVTSARYRWLPQFLLRRWLTVDRGC